jgi:predicted nicotinamide N-methyase
MMTPATSRREQRRSGPAGFVRAMCPLRPVPLVPEISLHLADEAFSLWEEIERDSGNQGTPPPFWAFAWPGGQALARYLLDRPELVAGRSVLDIGSGSGLAAIAAAFAGSSAVAASEIDSLAAAAISLNARANNAAVTVTGDVLDGDGEAANVVLAADVWYDRSLADRAAGLLRRARSRGADVLVADIGRSFLPVSMLNELAAYDVPVVAELEDSAVKRAMIFALGPLPEPAQQSGDCGVIGA